jgi:Glycosyl transferase family 2/Methyltransferase domain
MAVHLIEANALFVHVPKTGGVWIEKALAACGIATAPPPRRQGVSWRHSLPEDVLGTYDFTFAFVRHPVAWYESWWRFQRGHGRLFEPGMWHPQRPIEPYGTDDDFAAFIRGCIEHQPGYVTRMYEWYVGPPGIERVDFVGRQESLTDTLVRILYDLSYDFDETVLREQPRVNTSVLVPGEASWDPELKRRIVALEAPAIERFYGSGYEPPGSSERRASRGVPLQSREVVRSTRRQRPPELSVVLVAYDIPRELPRTLTSLSPSYQRHIASGDYEVIVVDNGSRPAVDISDAADNVRLIRIDEASASPAVAINRGLAAARGEIIAVMIDGARLASATLLHFGHQAARMYGRTVVASLGWHIGFDYQRLASMFAYDAAAEDALLESIGWPADGYRLFEIATMDGSSVDGWFPPIAESNCLFLSRTSWGELGGVDERFVMPGGGLLSLDMFRRALDLPEAELVILLSEGTFHQCHGGTATSLPRERFEGMWETWAAEYRAIRGEEYDTPRPKRPPTYVGTLPRPVLERFARAVVSPAMRRAAPLGDGFDPVRWTAQPWSRPTDPRTAALVDLVHEHLAAERPTAATAVVRLARGYDPDEPELRRLGSLLAPWMPFGEPGEGRRTEYHLALGGAHRVLGNRAQAIAEVRAALELDPDLPAAHFELSHLLLPGDFYLSWLERIYGFLEPRSVLEIGVADGQSLATVRRPAVAIGVDPAPSAMVGLSADAHLFHETSDEFFDAHRLDDLLDGPLGIAFIDGNHLYEQVLKDFVNVERHCGPRSLVMLHDTVPLDARTQSRTRETAFHSGDVWKVVPCLKHFRPDLDVITIGTPWTGLTLVSGFSEEDSGFADRYDEAVARFIDMPYEALGDDPLSELNGVPNDWDVVRPRLQRLRPASSPSSAPTPSAYEEIFQPNGARQKSVSPTRETLRRAQEELTHARQEYRRVDGELLAAQTRARELGAALDASRLTPGSSSRRSTPRTPRYGASINRSPGKRFSACADACSLPAVARIPGPSERSRDRFGGLESCSPPAPPTIIASSSWTRSRPRRRPSARRASSSCRRSPLPAGGRRIAPYRPYRPFRSRRRAVCSRPWHPVEVRRSPLRPRAVRRTRAHGRSRGSEA